MITAYGDAATTQKRHWNVAPTVEVCFRGEERKWRGRAAKSHFDPAVWTGRAVQAGFDDLEVIGLAHLYSAL